MVKKKFKLFEIIKLKDRLDYIPIEKGERCLYLGEIPNMEGHIAFEYKGKIFWGYHPENFIKIPKREL